MPKTRKLTQKQKEFCQAYTTPGKAYNNGTQAAIQAGYSQKCANVISAQNLVKANIKNEIVRIKAELAEKQGFTRESQLKDLESAKALAMLQENVPGMVSAIREQNEMLGFHRDKAPNPEAAQARQQRFKGEMAAIRRLVRTRTAELASEPPMAILEGEVVE